jgi:hypothetical protein
MDVMTPWPLAVSIAPAPNAATTRPAKTVRKSGNHAPPAIEVAFIDEVLRLVMRETENSSEFEDVTQAMNDSSLD